MSFGIASKRTDWLQAKSATAGTFTRSPALHEVIGNLSGYQGALTLHGDFCNRFTWSTPTDPTTLRYLHVDQRDDDDKACMVQAAMNHAGGAYGQCCCGVVIKAQSGCSLYDINCVAKANIVDGEMVTLYQTVAPTKTTNFIFDKGTSGPFDSDNIQVDISGVGVVTAEDVAEVLRTAINANSLPLRMAAERAGASSTVRVMRTDDGSTSGDIPTTDVADPGFTVAKTADGSAGTPTSNTVGGYTLTFDSDTNRYYLSRARAVTAGALAVYASVAAAPATLKRWIGLRLVAMRLGDDLRLRGYALSGYLNVDAMYTAPVWIPIIDAIHVAGSFTPVIVPISGVTQVADSFINGSPCYTGRSGMIFEWRGTDTFYASSPRIQSAVPVS